jgi:DNA-directed RNA polymerase specialized sigma subunit
LKNIQILKKECYMNSQEIETALAAPKTPLNKNIEILPWSESVKPEELEVPVSEDDTDLKSLYAQYAVNPSKENLFKVVSKMNPLINNSLNQLGESGNSLLKNDALLMTADAVKTFNPEQGAALQTWAASQLKQLRRKRRELNSVTNLPERVQIDAFHIERGMREFTDLNGDEPDIEELADYIKMPIKRINKVRSMMYRTPDSASISSEGVSQSQTDYTEEAMHYIYQDANKIDRKIMEHRLGFGGSKPLSNNELSAKLNLGPDVISKRLGRIINKVEKTYNILNS